MHDSLPQGDKMSMTSDSRQAMYPNHSRGETWLQFRKGQAKKASWGEVMQLDLDDWGKHAAYG